MYYNRQNFTRGQKLTANQMNQIDSGLYNVDQDLSDLSTKVSDLSDKVNTGGGSSSGSATLTIGTVTSGTTASASITDGKLNLVLPKGDKGDTGAAGKDGAAGAAGAKGDKGDKGDTGAGFTDNAKTLILSLFEGAAYGNASMQSQLDALKTEWGSSSGGGTTTVPVTSISLSKTTLSLQEGGSETLTATVTPSNATNKTVTWSVSPSGYATVSGGKVTAVKAGSCTITASCGGKTASCAVTVTAASTTTEDIPGETPVYKLAQATEITPSKANAIDTGVKLFETISPQPDWTILLEFEYNASLTSLYQQHAILHCMQESSPWPGLVFKAEKSGQFQANVYGLEMVIDSAANLTGEKRRFAFRISGSKIWGWSYNGNAIKNSSGNDISSYTSTVSNTAVIGAAKDTSGSYGYYFDGTVYKCLIYKKALTDSQIKGWVTG